VFEVVHASEEAADASGQPWLHPGHRTALRRTLLRGVDGDTINIDQAVRTVWIGTPESRLGGAPATAQHTLDRCRNRLEAGEFDEINKPLLKHLLDRLTPDAFRILGLADRIRAAWS
jgi:hypothetical protein